MHIIMVNISTKLKDFLTLKFLTLGIELYINEQPKEIEKILEEKGCGYLLITMNQMSSPWFNFLAQLKEHRSDDFFKLIVFSEKTDRDFIQALLLIGVVGVIPGTLEVEEIYKRLEKLVNLKNSDSEKREFLRITPRKNDDLVANLSIPNSSMIISAKIINISMGGMALQVSSTGEARWLSSGQVIESAQIRINGKIGMTAMKIVGVKETFVGARFMRPTDYFLNLLGRYIVDRMSG